MKLGIMQPYFFPYPGYFALIAQVDRWVVFDTPQYMRHGWVNRNRILHPGSGWQYIVAPLVKHRRSTSIRDIRLADPGALSGRIACSETCVPARRTAPQAMSPVANVATTHAAMNPMRRAMGPLWTGRSYLLPKVASRSG